ncbi:hypothetical protein DPQ33_02635 [Oceanidesulfovibrio indonesiensis]|uniref:DUF3619 domain-containing protein n=1 Tax=Oceanidesulfovibrio indonesiensis TaxID=54767 RepID=A0A7M3MIQ7_9BACT|nr:hypothetical protein [Oceanidesulfovibrio indonesiensis]TVM19275.1 hypothetical protein DPQ33_02635 [Oceanidesulfovibrio indonesiensis]
MKNEREFLHDVRHVLDESVDNLDGATRSALTRSRRAALERHEARAGGFRRWIRPAALPAAGLAAAAVLLVMVLQNGVSVPPEDFVADIEMLGAEETTDFFENLDFYLWISEEGTDEKSIDTTGLFTTHVAFVGGGPAVAPAGAAKHGASGVPRHARG